MKPPLVSNVPIGPIADHHRASAIARLRDELAMCALPAILTQELAAWHESGGTNKVDFPNIARLAYVVADAMLDERERA